MKRVLLPIVIMFVTSSLAYAQTGFFGTWRSEELQWTIILRADGTRVTGTVGSGGTQPVEIYEGRIEGNTVRFKARSPDGDRTITFTGKVDNESIEFTREVQVREGGARGGNGIFGASAPVRFNATRVTGAAVSPQSAPSGGGGQVADTTFHHPIEKPAYPAGTGPVVLLDESHDNFHTSTGRYLPFAELLRRDGYVVKASVTKFTAEALKAGRVLVIANAVGAVTAEEVTALRNWVADGGSLLLIADHPPFDTAAKDLGKPFGIRFSGGAARDPNDSTGRLVFRRSDGTLKDHSITEGIDEVATFTGSSFEVEGNGQPLLVFGAAVNLSFENDSSPKPLKGHLQGAAVPFGKGRVAVFGEAAMFSAQITGLDRHPMGMNAPIAKQNAQFLLNVMHWLTR